MIWYILTALSAVLFFGFVILGITKYGLLSCYSAYGPLWHRGYSKINWWQIITILSALLLVPVLLERKEGDPYQFLGFLAPISLTLVGISPGYQNSTFENIIHQTGAWSAILFIILYMLIVPSLLWIIGVYLVIALIIGLVLKGTLMFWGEMAMYLSTYTILFNII